MLAGERQHERREGALAIGRCVGDRAPRSSYSSSRAIKHNKGDRAKIQCLWPRRGLRAQGMRSLRRGTLDHLDRRKLEPALLETPHEEVPVALRAPHPTTEREERTSRIDVSACEPLDSADERAHGLLDDGLCHLYACSTRR